MPWRAGSWLPFAPADPDSRKGLNVARLFIYRGDVLDREIDLGERSARIGRSDDNEILLADSTMGVSRHHAELRFEQGKYTVVDLNSQNGVWVAGRRVLKTTLEPGVPVVVGSYKLLLKPERPPADETGDATVILPVMDPAAAATIFFPRPKPGPPLAAAKAEAQRAATNVAAPKTAPTSATTSRSKTVPPPAVAADAPKVATTPEPPTPKPVPAKPGADAEPPAPPPPAAKPVPAKPVADAEPSAPKPPAPKPVPPRPLPPPEPAPAARLAVAAKPAMGARSTRIERPVVRRACRRIDGGGGRRGAADPAQEALGGIWRGASRLRRLRLLRATRSHRLPLHRPSLHRPPLDGAARGPAVSGPQPPGRPGGRPRRVVPGERSSHLRPCHRGRRR